MVAHIKISHSFRDYRPRRLRAASLRGDQAIASMRASSTGRLLCRAVTGGHIRLNLLRLKATLLGENHWRFSHTRTLLSAGGMARHGGSTCRWLFCGYLAPVLARPDGRRPRRRAHRRAFRSTAEVLAQTPLTVLGFAAKAGSYLPATGDRHLWRSSSAPIPPRPPQLVLVWSRPAPRIKASGGNLVDRPDR